MDPFRRLAHGQRSKVKEPRTVVAETPEGWRDVWRLTNQSGPSPHVDLTAEMVVAVFAGMRPHAGWDVRVTDVRREAAHVVVEVTALTPHPEGLYAQVLVHPYDVVAIPKADLPVAFEMRERVAPPPGQA